jgi:DNA-binding response OmpR family regulator
MKAVRVLLVDDDPATIQAVQPALEGAGCHLRCAAPGRGVVADALRDPPDLIVLGINGDRRGWALCRELLAHVDAPLFLLLGSRREADRIRGLKMGAAGCVSKGTCSPIELVARLRAVLRRSGPPPEAGPQGDGD